MSTNLTKEEICDLIKTISIERQKHHQLNIIKEVIFEWNMKNPGLLENLQLKAYNILMAEEVEECMIIGKDRLLGLSSFNLTDLSYEEKKQLGELVEKDLITTSHTIFKDLEKLNINLSTRCTEFRSPFDLSREDKVLFDFKSKLVELQQTHMLKLQELLQVLEEILKIKTKELPDILNEIIHAHEITMEFLRLRTQVLDTKLKVDIFTETDCSLDAYKHILKDILQEQVQLKHDIENQEVLKEKYRQVSCRQYNDILKSYLQYKVGIEKRKLLLNMLHK